MCVYHRQKQRDAQAGTENNMDVYLETRNGGYVADVSTGTLPETGGGDRKAQVTKVTTGTLGRHCRLRSSRRSRSSNSHLAVVQRLKTCSVMKRCAPCSIAPCFLSHSPFFPSPPPARSKSPWGPAQLGGNVFPQAWLARLDWDRLCRIDA